MRVVNVCFHGVGVPRREMEPGEDAYWVDRDTFLRVLDRLAGRDDVRLSFDDGNSSDIEVAFPALRERGLRAAFFVVAGRLDRAGSLGREDVQELHHGGMTIGSHGMWHRPWRGMDDAQHDAELVQAREVLADLTGQPVHDAALPLGRYDRRLLQQLRRLDYRTVHTSDRRWARPGSWLQPRYSIRRGDSAESVERTVLHRPSPYVHARGVAVGTAKRLR